MIDWLYFTLVIAAGASAFWCLVLAMFGFKPGMFSLAQMVLLEVLLVVQLITTSVLVSTGAQSKGDVVEFFGYVLVAMMVPVGGVIWALVERTRVSSMVLAVAALTVAVMAARMAQIWGLA